MGMNQTVSKNVYIRNELGLHARPAALLAQEAAQFESSITLRGDGMVVDAKSVLDILSLAATQGKTILLQAEGSDAQQAVRCLEDLFTNGFGE